VSQNIPQRRPIQMHMFFSQILA